jgi:streptogramin lyase
LSQLAPRRLPAILGLVLALALGVVATASAAPAVNGTFLVPGVETNNKIVAGPDGNMWVTVNDGANDVARITPAGDVKAFELEGVANATGIAVEGANLWVSFGTGVAKFQPADPKGTSKATELGINGADSLVLGPDGNIWVAANEKVVHFPPADPTKATTIEIEKLKSKDIDVAGSLLVIADQGEKSRIVTLTIAGVEKNLPIGGGSQGVAGAPTGQLAFSAAEAKPEQAGLITPPNPAQSFELLGDPFGVAYGADEAFWIVQFAAGQLTRLDSAGQRSILGSFPKETARQIAAGPNNTLWVTLIKNEALKTEPSVVRISGLEKPLPPKLVPKTTLGKGPRVVRTAKRTAKVSFRFKSDVAGSTFQCALTKLRKGKKQAKPNFKTCKSPKVYRLRPGRYSFQVRALSAGGTDATPAKRTVKVVRIHRHRHHHR